MRAWDQNAICARGEFVGFDSIAARSQNADRSAKDAVRREQKAWTADFGSVLAPIIPGGTIWLRKERRFMIGQEVLMVQGVYEGPFGNMSQSEMKEIAGQAMCCGSTIPALVATDVFW